MREFGEVHLGKILLHIVTVPNGKCTAVKRRMSSEKRIHSQTQFVLRVLK